MNRRSVLGLAFVTVLAWLPVAAADIHPELWPEGPKGLLIDPKIEARIDALMAKMTLEEKVGQTIQADIGGISPDDLKRYPLGSILAGGGSGPGGDDLAPAPAWLDLVDQFYRVSMEERAGHQPIPIMFGIDAVHGHNNIIGATLFPHNIALGAAHDPELVRRIGAATAEEVAATGIDWTFAPTVAVVQDVRWGRTYESYSEDPALVASYAAQMVSGLQGRLGAPEFEDNAHVTTSVKHFLGDGGTRWGRDQGDNQFSEADLIRLHAAGYLPAIKAGALTVMASYNSWQGTKMHADKALLTDVLKGRMGFNGFIVGDWNAHDEIDGCNDASCPEAFNAGLDMFMVSARWKDLFDNTLAQVKAGKIAESRLDDAVRRILRVKFLSGLFDKGAPKRRPLSGAFELLGSASHRAVAREAVHKSLVLLKNDAHLLPLKPGMKLLVTGDGADNIGKQAGGWTLSWQGSAAVSRDYFPGATSIWDGIKAADAKAVLSPDGSFADKPDAAIVVFGENPYAEFNGDLETLDYLKADLAVLKTLKAAGIPTVAVFLSGRPRGVNAEINASTAFVAAWQPGSEGAAVADVLFGKEEFSGKLSFTWQQFPRGFGLTTKDHPKPAALPEQAALAPPHAEIVRAGYVAAPWSLTIGDKEGGIRATLAAQTSGAGAVTEHMVIAGGAPASLDLTWSGKEKGGANFSALPENWRPLVAGEPVLLMRWRVTEPASGTVTLGGKPVTALMRAAGDWQVSRFKLSCFPEGPILDLVSEGKLALSIADLEIVADAGDAVCPAWQ